MRSIGPGTTLRARTISLRLARPLDAPLILSLRTDPALARHLSPTEGGLDGQRVWLERYVEREHRGEEYYFIIVRNEPKADCGTVRLYDFCGDSFCWGSWILGERKTPTAAIESAVLVYDFAFATLGFRRSHFDVRLDNETVIKFHRRFGARPTRRDESNQYFELTREEFEARRPHFSRLIERAGAARELDG